MEKQEEEEDFEGLVRLIGYYQGEGPDVMAHAIFESEWLLRHEFKVVRSFVKDIQEGLEEA